VVDVITMSGVRIRQQALVKESLEVCSTALET
jgi:hypothetical protein